VAIDLARQNHRYVELMFSPSLFKQRGLETQKLVLAVKMGLSKVEELKFSLIGDLVRDYGPEQESRTLAELAETKEMGVIGIGIGGSEHAYPPEPFAGVYEKARKIGFHTTAHAGEAAGANSVWGAIRSLQAERIGHGIRAGEDEALLNHLVEKGIPLDMCPLSNVCTGVVTTLAHHPIREFFDRGVRVSVNTDDPKMFGNSLAEEFQLLEKTLRFSRKDIKRLTSNAIRASWLRQDEMSRLEQRVLSDPVWGV
jgi:adenosine deaminase